jgi:membrane-associated phospholipid phosphatase
MWAVNCQERFDRMSQPDLTVTRSQRIVTIVLIVICIGMAVASWHRFDETWTPGAKRWSTTPDGYVTRVVSGLGNTTVPLALFVMLWLLWNEKRLAIAGGLAMVFGSLVTTLGKGISWRPRPDSGEDSFPSGHTALVFAVAFVLGQRYPKLRWLFYLIAAAVGATRVLLRKHYPSDVFVATAVGLLAAMLAIAVAKKIPDPPDRRWLRIVLAVVFVALCAYTYFDSRKLQRMSNAIGPAVILVVGVRCGQLIRERRKKAASPVSTE